MHNWYVVHCLSNQENKVKKMLEENRGSQGMTELVQEVLIPIENVAETKGGQHKVIKRRIYSGYIFVKMQLTDESWSYVTGTNGVIGFAAGKKHPQPLSQEEVDNLFKDIEEKKKGVVHKYNFVPGDRVKIIHGSFQSFEATVSQVFQAKGRLEVIVSIFGRETATELDITDVEMLTDEAKN